MNIAQGLYTDATGFCFGPPVGTIKPPSGNPTVDSDTLPMAFSVPDTDNMFRSACDIPVTVSFAKTKPCTKSCKNEAPACPIYVPEEPPVIAVLSQTGIAPTGPGCTTVTDFRKYDANKVYNNTAPAYTAPISLVLAAQQCRALLSQLASSPETMQVREFMINSCAEDYAATGDEGVLETSRQAYNGASRQVLQAESRSNYPETRVKAAATQQAYGLGNFDCPEGCGGSGVCAANGCKCDQGFYGQRCEIDNAQNIMYDSVATTGSNLEAELEVDAEDDADDEADDDAEFEDNTSSLESNGFISNSDEQGFSSDAVTLSVSSLMGIASIVFLAL
jgi:hypothetical protein